MLPPVINIGHARSNSRSMVCSHLDSRNLQADQVNLSLRTLRACRELVVSPSLPIVAQHQLENAQIWASETSNPSETLRNSSRTRIAHRWWPFRYLRYLRSSILSFSQCLKDLSVTGQPGHVFMLQTVHCTQRGAHCLYVYVIGGGEPRRVYRRIDEELL